MSNSSFGNSSSPISSSCTSSGRVSRRDLAEGELRREQRKPTPLRRVAQSRRLPGAALPSPPAYSQGQRQPHGNASAGSPALFALCICWPIRAHEKLCHSWEAEPFFYFPKSSFVSTIWSTFSISGQASLTCGRMVRLTRMGGRARGWSGGAGPADHSGSSGSRSVLDRTLLEESPQVWGAHT